MKKLMAGLCALTLSVTVSNSMAYQVDAAQQALAQEHRDQWRKEDNAIQEKLTQLRNKNDRPNIIMILTDDIGWGELGSYGGGKLRGTPTPNLDTLAADGMKLLQHYSEPSCTPTRAALMTGRLPIRSGLDEVLFPGQVKGLVAEEYTLAELLSDAGYRTAMFGKWHMGEQPQHQPTNQGFDYALYTMFNGGVWPWSENADYYDPENETIGEVPYTLDMPKNYEQQTGIVIHGIQESRKGEKPREIGKLTLERYNVHEQELTEGILDFVEDNAKKDDPFFVYWASNANQVFFCPPEERNTKYVDKANCQASQLAQHDKNVKRLRDKLEQLDIAKNTLVLWVSDNGPMYQFFPAAGFSYLRGKKHQVYEGGVRTPAIAWWPGVIAAGQDPIDLVHVTDWYTTIAQIAGATKLMPGKRIIDGVDQTSLLLNGEGYSRRDYVFHYEYQFFNKESGSRLAAVRWKDTKLHLKQPVEIYNIMRDPKEEFSMRAKYLWAVIPMRKMVYEHQNMMEKFPNRKIKETAGSKLAY
ncbi:MAG: sulfatase-like hydrolase/transferase [Pseudomonadales bacterium]